MASKLPPQAYQANDADTPMGPAYHAGSGAAFPSRSWWERLPQGDEDTDAGGSRPPPSTTDKMPYPMPDDGSDRET